MSAETRIRTYLAFVVAAVALCLVPGRADAVGLLVPDREEVRPFDIESHRVDVTVTHNAAVTEVVQVFRNHTDRQQEGTFVFPLPKGATVSEFSLWMDGEELEGAVLDAGEARDTYRSIVRRTEDPGLVEYVGARMFRASIFPIPPNSTKKLKLKFNQTLERQDEMYRYDYPMGAGSDYVTAETQKDFTVQATIRSPVPVTAVYSPTHDIDTTEGEDGRVRVGTESMHERLDQDFELFVGYSKRDIGLNLMSYDRDGEGGEDGYFMAALAPQLGLEEGQELPQAYTFVIDTSGSMEGDKIEQARRTLEYCIERLDPNDRFNVVDFATGTDRLFSKPKRATESVRSRGLGFAADLEANGGTAIMGGMEAALDQEVPAEYVHHVVFVTDGMPTIGETEPNEILKKVGEKVEKRERIFSFGVGYDVDTDLVDGLARTGEGRSDYVEPEEDLSSAISSLYERISSPVLTGIEVDFGGADTYDVYPRPTPDLFRGGQVVLFGRYRDAFTGTIEVSGRAAGEKQTFEYETGGGAGSEAGAGDGPSIASSELAFIPELWGTRKVGYLLEQIRLNGERPELREEVVRIAKRFGLVTPYTSYLAVDDREMERRASADSPDRSSTYDFGGDDVEGDLTSPDSSATRGKAGSGSGDASARKRPKFRARRRAGGSAEKEESSSPSASTASESSSAESSSDDPDLGALTADTGSRGVESAERTGELKRKSQVESESERRRRYVADRTFVLRDGVWVESNLEGDELEGEDVERVETFSERYFELLEKFDALRRIGKIGEEVVCELDGQVYRFVAKEE